MNDQKTLSIRIPEGVEFSMPIADPIARCIAWLVDVIIKTVVILALASIISLCGIFLADLSGSILSLSVFMITLFYAVYFEFLWCGQTPGKRLMKLRVVDARGLNLSFVQILIRNLLRLVDILPFAYVLGGTAALFSRKGQRLGDIAAGTAVVFARSVSMPDISKLKPEQYNSLRDYAYVTARLRQLTAPEEALLVANAILRRDQLAPEARLKVFSALRNYYEQKARYPETLTVGMSDEQYVRNLADILFR